MTNLDKVLLAIKMECDKLAEQLEVSCFDRVAERTKISRQGLADYIQELQSRGYIGFSEDQSSIYVTAEGEQYIR